MKKQMCKKYLDSKALPNEAGKCSLCGGRCFEPIRKKFLVPIQIDGQIIDDILCTAFEGGSNYWLDSVQIIGKTPKDCKYSSEAISRNGKLLFVEQETDYKGKQITHVLNRQMMLDGIGLFISAGNELDEGMDAGMADMCLKYALFGKIIYG